MVKKQKKLCIAFTILTLYPLKLKLWKTFIRKWLLGEKCPYLEFLWSVFFRIWTEYG